MSQISCSGPELALVLAEGALTTGTQGSHGCLLPPPPRLPRLSEDLLPAEGGHCHLQARGFPSLPWCWPTGRSGPAEGTCGACDGTSGFTGSIPRPPTPTAQRQLSCVPCMVGTRCRDTACSPGLSSPVTSRLAMHGGLVGSGNHGAKDGPWRVRPPQGEPDMEA